MKRFNAFQLKVLAIVAMFINHLGYAFETVFHPVWWQGIYLTIGLVTFPVMAYLLVDGFYYTKNRWKYVGRLAIFWLVSILPFHLLFEGIAGVINPFNNIFFTLMMGILLLMLCERYPDLILQALLCLFFVVLTIQSDWNLFGIPLIFGFYKNRGYKTGIRHLLLLVTVGMFFLLDPKELSLHSSEVIRWLSSIGLVLVIPLLERYNGERGIASPWAKWLFYLFYPLHLLLLFGIRLWVFGY